MLFVVKIPGSVLHSAPELGRISSFSGFYDLGHKDPFGPSPIIHFVFYWVSLDRFRGQTLEVTMFATAQNNVSKGWLALSVSSLILAGILAGVLVVGRLPPFHHLFSDPLFFKRCLIVHVELSLFVWFFSFFVFLFSQLPGSKMTSLWQSTGLFLAFSGVAARVLSAGSRANGTASASSGAQGKVVSISMAIVSSLLYASTSTLP